MPQVGVAGIRTAYIHVYIMYKCIYLVIKTSHPASNKTPLSVRTCSDLVIENKSHPASNETPLSSKYTHVAICMVIENKSTKPCTFVLCADHEQQHVIDEPQTSCGLLQLAK